LPCLFLVAQFQVAHPDFKKCRIFLIAITGTSGQTKFRDGSSVGEFIAIEPVVFDGGWKTTSLGEWKVVSSTSVRSAHFENTVYISKFGPVILTE